MSLRLLVVASETSDQQAARRGHVGEASHETYASTLRAIDGACRTEHVSCIDRETRLSPRELARFDGIFFAGSPIQMHEETAETRAAAAFMTDVFDAGTATFGSCAGLQIAAVAAGGTCKARESGIEAGFARGIIATEAGRRHPLLQGRPLSWSAPALHSSRVDRLPEGATVLAQAEGTPVEAAEIRSGNGVFWGVQYHPEITVAEIAASLRRQSADLIEEGLAGNQADVDAYAAKLEALDAAPGRRDLAWQFGLDDEVLDPQRRTREISNFFRHLTERSASCAAPARAVAYENI